MLFCFFETFSVNFTENPSFLFKKVNISDRSTEIVRNKFEKGENRVENLDVLKQLFLIKPVKWDK